MTTNDAIEQQVKMDEAMNREQIINSMCLTYRHDYGLTISEDDRIYTLNSGVTETERENIWNTMAQIFDHNISPYMEFKDGI